MSVSSKETYVMRRRSAEAKDLASPKYRQKVVPSARHTVDRSAVVVCSHCREPIAKRKCDCDAGWDVLPDDQTIGAD
jgi:hypothetical protein